MGRIAEVKAWKAGMICHIARKSLQRKNLQNLTIKIVFVLLLHS